MLFQSEYVIINKGKYCYENKEIISAKKVKVISAGCNRKCLE